jgi:hypothetical protein
VKEIKGWVMGGVGSVSVTVETPPPGGTASADEASRRFADFESQWKGEARQLPEHAAALKAAADLAAAQQRRDALRQEQVAAAEESLDLSGNALDQLATREASLKAQGDLLDRRLPALVDALSTARHHLTVAAAGLRTRLRLSALDTACRSRDGLVTALAADGRLGDLLTAFLVAESLARGGITDESVAAGFALQEVPPPAAPASRSVATDPFAPDTAFHPVAGIGPMLPSRGRP